MYRFIRPTLPAPEAWLPYLEQSYEQKFFSNFGPLARLLEARLSSVYDPRRAVVAVSSATSGLTACLHALEVQGKVIVPSFTFAATAQAVVLAGCEPVFCDVAEDSWLLDTEALRELITEHQPVAVMPVRSFGMYQDSAPLAELCKEYSLPLVIDSAPAFGGSLEPETENFTGEENTFEVFSFHATKVFGVGEGGAIFAPRSYEDAIRRAVNFGLQSDDVVQVAGNGKLNEFTAAISLAVLENLKGMVCHRQEIAARYKDALTNRKGVEHLWAFELSSWQTFPVLLSEGVKTETVVSVAAELGLELRRYYYLPLHQTKAFHHCVAGPMGVTESLSARIVCLPVYSDMTPDEQSEITELFLTALNRTLKLSEHLSAA